MAVLTNEEYAEFFNTLKKCIESFYYLEIYQLSDSTGLRKFRSNVTNQFSTIGLEELLGNLPNFFDDVDNAFNEAKESIIVSVENLLEYYGREKLFMADASDPGAVLDALGEAMLADNKTVLTRACDIAAADAPDGEDGVILAADGTGGYTNIGDSQLVYTLTPPVQQLPTERAFAEEMHCICTSSRVAKSAVFQLSGASTQNRASHLRQGSGQGPSLTEAGNSLGNGWFDDWTTTKANDWELGTGDWGTVVEQEATITYRGPYSLKINTTLADALVYEARALTLLSDACYAVGLWVYRPAGVTGDLELRLGTWVDDTWTSQKLLSTVDLSTLTEDSWNFVHATFDLDGREPSDWYLGFTVDTLSAAIYIDGVQFTEMTEHNSIHFAIFTGATDAAVGDRFGDQGSARGFDIAATEPADDGVIQYYLARWFGKQLPSAAVPTYTDPI